MPKLVGKDMDGCINARQKGDLIFVTIANARHLSQSKTVYIFKK
jgi:hypothetical protein